MKAVKKSESMIVRSLSSIRLCFSTNSFLLELIKRKGSSAVFLAIAFLAFSVCIAGSIGISRKLAVMSECQTFGRVWTKAILSEYDRHLLEDFKLMAYWGNETEVNRKLEAYMDYSLSYKLGLHRAEAGSELTGYELGDPDNFSEALNKGFAGSAVEAFLHGAARRKRETVYSASEEETSGDADGDAENGNPRRVIGNQVVLDTLPSGGMGGTVSDSSLLEKARSAENEDGVMSAAAGAGTEIAFMWRYFSSCVTVPDDKPHYLFNELEYVIRGSPDDKVNYDACRNRIFLVRNALNLAALYRDPAKVELITTVAQTITPGPLGAATQVILSEAWAAYETKKDLEVLYDNGRIPVLKTPEQWMTDLASVLGSNEVRNKLDDESRELLDESSEELSGIPGLGSAGALITEGLSYDDHLLLMILCMNSRLRLLRLMDIVQIDMKYRYYRDFNFMEYYTGVRYGITADGNNYVFEDHYK